VSKHVRVLERAGLVHSERRGREHFIRVEPGPAEAAQGWIAYYAAHWRAHFAAVEGLLSQRKEHSDDP
jgi:DNA-binding transcriptional ArsR family regulator